MLNNNNRLRLLRGAIVVLRQKFVKKQAEKELKTTKLFVTKI